MRRPFRQVLESGDFTIYSRQVDQRTLEELVILSRDGVRVAAVVKRRGVVVEATDALDKE